MRLQTEKMSVLDDALVNLEKRDGKGVGRDSAKPIYGKISKVKTTDSIIVHSFFLGSVEIGIVTR